MAHGRLEEGKPQRWRPCATCVAVTAAVAGGTASAYESVAKEAGICRRNLWGQPTCNMRIGSLLCDELPSPR